MYVSPWQEVVIGWGAESSSPSILVCLALQHPWLNWQQADITLLESNTAKATNPGYRRWLNDGLVKNISNNDKFQEFLLRLEFIKFIITF